MTEKFWADRFEQNLLRIQERIAAALQKASRTEEEVKLIGVTKTVPVDLINQSIQCGITAIGENRVQEFLQKEPSLLPCERHIIGHLQTNKVKQIAGKIDLLQSLDSVKLAAELDKWYQCEPKPLDVLVELNIGGEESKSGIDPVQLESFLEQIAVFGHIKVRGMMAIPPFSPQKEDSRRFFYRMTQLFVDIRRKKLDNISMDFLSMGMSHDFDVAIEEGANVVRIGSAMYGAR